MKITINTIILLWLKLKTQGAKISLNQFIEISKTKIEYKERVTINKGNKDFKYIDMATCVILSGELLNIGAKVFGDESEARIWINLYKQNYDLPDVNGDEIIRIVKAFKDNVLNNGISYKLNSKNITSLLLNDSILLNDGNKTTIIYNTDNKFNYYNRLHNAFSPNSDWRIVSLDGENFAVRFIDEQLGYEYFNLNSNFYYEYEKRFYGGRLVDAYLNNTQQSATIKLQQGTPKEIRKRRKDAVKDLGIKQYDEAVEMVSFLYGDIINKKRGELISRLHSLLEQNVDINEKVIIEKQINDIEQSDYEVVKALGGSQTIFNLIAQKVHCDMRYITKEEAEAINKPYAEGYIYSESKNKIMQTAFNNALDLGHATDGSLWLKLETNEEIAAFNNLLERYKKLEEHLSIIINDATRAIEKNHRVIVRIKNTETSNETEEQIEEQTEAQEEVPVREGWQVSDAETSFVDKLSDDVKRRFRTCIKTKAINNSKSADHPQGMKNDLPPFCAAQVNSFGYPIHYKTNEIMNMVLESIEGEYTPEGVMEAMRNLYLREPGIVDLYTELKESYEAQEGNAYSNKGRFFTEFFHRCVNDNIHMVGVFNNKINHDEHHAEYDELQDILNIWKDNFKKYADFEQIKIWRDQAESFFDKNNADKKTEFEYAVYASYILQASKFDISPFIIYNIYEKSRIKYNNDFKEAKQEKEELEKEVGHLLNEKHLSAPNRIKVKKLKSLMSELEYGHFLDYDGFYNKYIDLLERIFYIANDFIKNKEIEGTKERGLIAKLQYTLPTRKERSYEYNNKVYYSHRIPTEMGRVFSALSHEKTRKKEMIKRVLYQPQIFNSKDEVKAFLESVGEVEVYDNRTHTDLPTNKNYIAIEDSKNNIWYVGQPNWFEIDRDECEKEYKFTSIIHINSLPLYNPLLKQSPKLRHSVGFNMQEYGDYTEIAAIKNMLIEYKDGFYQMPIPSDGGSCYFFANGEYINKYSNEEILSIINREIARIKMLNNPSFNHKIKAFSKRGKEFCLFPELNTLKLQLANGNSYTLLEALDLYNQLNQTKDIDDETSNKSIQEVFGYNTLDELKLAYIEQVMRNDFHNTMNYWKSIGLFEVETKKINDGRTCYSLPQLYGTFLNSSGSNLDEIMSKVQNELWEFYKSHIVNTANVINLLFGDIAFSKNDVDFQKRFKQSQAPMMRCNTHAFYGRDKMRALTLQDEEIMSKTKSAMISAISNYKNLSEIEKKAVISSLNSINVTDGQGFRSFSSMRAVLDMTGKWTEAHEAAFERLQNGTWHLNDLNIFMISLKPLYYGMDMERDENGNVINIPSDRKMSEAVLLSLLANVPNIQRTSPVLTGLAQFMEDNVIDVVYFNSATKVGEHNVIAAPTTEEFHNSESVRVYLEKSTGLQNRPDKPYTNKEMRAAVTQDRFKSKMIQVHDYSQYGIQQEKPNHFIDSENLIGTQMRKHIKADMPDDAQITIGLGSERKILTKRQWLDYYNSIMTTNIMESYMDLSNRFLDIENIAQSLRDIMKNDSEVDDDFFDALEIVETEDGKKVFNLALADPILIGKIEKKLNSITNKTITNQKTRGGSLVQVSCYGLEELAVVFEYTDKNGNVSEIRKSDINAQNLDPNRLRVKYMECYMPVYDSKLLEYLVKTQGNVPIFNVDMIPEELLKSLGYRIPTEDKYSIAPLKIVGFLNQNMGGSICLPADITNISGSDFDIDVMYLIFPSIEFKEYDYQYALSEFMKTEEYANFISKLAQTDNVKQAVINICKNPNDEDFYYLCFLTTLYNILNDGFGELNNHPIAKKINRVFNFNNVKRPTIVKYDYNLHPSQQKKIARNNALLELIHGAMTSQYMTDKFLNPGNFQELERLSLIVNLCKFANPTDIVDANGNIIPIQSLYRLDFDTLQKMSKGILPSGCGTSVLSPATYSYFYKQNSEGKQMTAVMAANSATHSIIQQCQFDGQDIRMQTDERGMRYSNQYLDDVYSQKERDGSQKYISKLCGMQVQAATDTAKNPTLSTCNINKYTANFDHYLVRNGFSLEDVVLITSQPLVKIITNVYFNELSLTNNQNRANYKVDKVVSELKSKLKEKGYNLDVLTEYNGKWINIPAENLIYNIYKGRKSMTLDTFINLAQNPQAVQYITEQLMALTFFLHGLNEGRKLISLSSQFRSDKTLKGFSSNVIIEENKRTEEHTIDKHLKGKEEPVHISVQSIDDITGIEDVIKTAMLKREGYVTIGIKNDYPDIETLNIDARLEVEKELLLTSESKFGGKVITMYSNPVIVYDVSDNQQKLAMLTTIMGHKNDPIQTTFYYTSIASRRQIYNKAIPFFGTRYKYVADKLSEIGGVYLNDLTMGRMFKELSIYMLCNLSQVANRRNYLVSKRDVQRIYQKGLDTGETDSDEKACEYLEKLTSLDKSDKDANLYNFFHYCQEQAWFKEECRKGNRFLGNLIFLEDRNFADVEINSTPAGAIVYDRIFLDTEDDAKEVKEGWRNLFALDNTDAKRLAVELWLHILNRGLGTMNGYGKYCPIEVRQAVSNYTEQVQQIMNEANDILTTDIFDIGEFIIQYIRNHKDNAGHYVRINEESYNTTLSMLKLKNWREKEINVPVDDLIQSKRLAQYDKDARKFKIYPIIKVDMDNNKTRLLAIDGNIISRNPDCMFAKYELERMKGLTYKEVKPLGYGINTVEYFHGEGATAPDSPSIYDGSRPKLNEFNYNNSDDFNPQNPNVPNLQDIVNQYMAKNETSGEQQTQQLSQQNREISQDFLQNIVNQHMIEHESFADKLKRENGFENKNQGIIDQIC